MGVTLACVAYGSPLPVVKWLINGREIINGTGNALISENILEQANISFTQSILQLCPVMPDNGGEYACYANNIYGSHTIVFQVTVEQGIATYT